MDVTRFRLSSRAIRYSLPTILKIIWKNGSFRNRENLHYKKTADSVLLSLFMSINGKCNSSYAPSKAIFCFPSEPSIHEGTEYEIISTVYRCTSSNLHCG